MGTKTEENKKIEFCTDVLPSRKPATGKKVDKAQTYFSGIAPK